MPEQTPRTSHRWSLDIGLFCGFAVGATWAYGHLWINLGPLQVVVGRGA